MLLVGLAGCERVKSAVGKLVAKRDPSGATTEAAVVQGSYSSEQVAPLTKAGHPEFIARKNALIIVDFHAEWCGPCKMLGPVLVRAAEAHPGVVYVGKVNVDQENALAGEQKVSGIPDVRIYRDGKEVDRFVGFPGEDDVLERVARLSAGIIPVAAGEGTPASSPDQALQPSDKKWLPPGMTRGGAVAPPKAPGSGTPR